MEPSIPGGVCKFDELQRLPYVNNLLVPNDVVPLDSNYFSLLGKYKKYPLMKNKRKRDPIITKALLSNDLEIETGYGLPRMNLDASYKSLSKYAKGELPFDEEAYCFAKSALEMEFLPYMGNSEVRTLEEGLVDVDLSTSPGFPWNLQFKTKRDLYESSEYPFFVEYCKQDWEDLVNGKWYVFSNSLKEEVRLDEKIQANKIRTFTASPAEAVVSGNRLFGHMNEKFIDSHLKTASVVGLNPFKGGWHELYMKLKNHPKKDLFKIVGFELDESEYDSSIRTFLFQAVVEFRLKCLKNPTVDDKKRVFNYYANVVSSVIITADGNIVQKHLGNPSGSVNTISDNTLILYFLLSYAWYKLAPFPDISDFKSSVVLALQGDDNTWSVDEETAKFYNARSVSQVFSELGITTTSPCYDAREIEELSFLSSSFSRFFDHVCVYDLDTGKILESLKWTEYPNDPIRTLERVAACLLNTWPNNEARWLCRKLASIIVQEYDPVLQGQKEWVDQKSKLWTDEMFLFFYVGEAGALNNISHIKEFSMESLIKNAPSGFCYQAKPKNKKQKNKNKRKNKKQKRKMERKMKRSLKRGAGRMSSRGPAMVPVGIATSGVSRPSFKIGSSAKGTDAIFVRGHERLGVVTVAAPITEGTVILNQLISPELIGARLKGFAKLYDRYCFVKMTFKYVPLISAANANANGGIVMAIDYDPDDPTPAATRASLNSSFSSEFAEENAVFSAGIMPAKKINPRKDYYIDDNGLDERWSKQARFYVFASGALAAGTYGDIIFEYSVHLYAPQNQPPVDEMGGLITGGGTLAPANLLGTSAVVDADARNISISSSGVITFNAEGNVLVALNVSGNTFPGSIASISGWTSQFNTFTTTDCTTARYKYVTKGETLGPFTLASGTVTSSTLRIAIAPVNSFAFSEAQLSEVNKRVEFNRLLSRLTILDKFIEDNNLDVASKGFVKLPRLGKEKKTKVVEDDSE